MNESTPVRREYPVETTFGAGAIPWWWRAWTDQAIEEGIRELERRRKIDPGYALPKRPPRRVPLM